MNYIKGTSFEKIRKKNGKDLPMAQISRRESREQALGLLFETEFQMQKTPEEIYQLAMEDREIVADEYLSKVYFGVLEKKAEIDGYISKYSKGWSMDRIAPVTRNILRLSVYEMLNCPDIPVRVSINEAVELTKKYDEEKAKAFVNGILNSVKNELGTRE
ncbi:MAG: transcription antitermination factor NusB [Ruminococcaceae bacterium]|nr:transcription antitermination factor NusB [Oscillospiraceae bacterium]